MKQQSRMKQQHYQWLKAIILGSLSLMNGILTAATNPPLEHYIQLGTTQNPMVQSYWNVYQSTLEKTKRSTYLDDPVLEGGFFVSPMETMTGKQVADIKLMQMFPWFGTLKFAKKESEMMSKMVYESYLDAVRNVVYEIQSNWYQLYRIRAERQLIQQNLVLLSSLEQLTLSTIKGGKSTGKSVPSSSQGNALPNQSVSSGNMDNMRNNKQSVAQQSMPMNAGMSNVGSGGGLDIFLDNRLLLQTYENKLISLNMEEQVVNARLNGLMYRPDSLHIEVADTLYALPVDAHLLNPGADFFDHHPMLVMLQNEQLSLQYKEKMQQKMGLPMIGLGLNYSILSKDVMSNSSMNGKDMVMPMVSLSLPLNRKKTASFQKETQWLSASTEKKMASVKFELHTAYLEALKQYRDAELSILLLDQSLAFLNQTLEVGVKRFSTGNMSLSDIQNLRLKKIDLEMKRIQAVVDFNTAKAQLYKLSGKQETASYLPSNAKNHDEKKSF